MKQLAFCILIAFALFSCKLKKTERPAYIIPEQKFVRVLIDYHLAQSMGTSSLFRKKVNTFKQFNITDSVLKRHGYNQAAFDSTMAYYSNDPKKFEMLYDQVLNELNRKHADVQIEMDKKKKAVKK